MAAGGRVSVHTQVSWSAPLKVGTTADPEELHQGSDADVTTTLTPGAETITLRYRLPYELGIFAHGGDFPAGPAWFATGNLTLVDEATETVSTQCTPKLNGDGTGTCQATDTINLLPETCFFPLCPVDLTVNLVVNHTFTVGEDGIIAHRMSTQAPDADITYNGPSPASHTEALSVPCTAAVGDDVSYDLSGFTYSPDESVSGSAALQFVIDGPGPLNAEPSLDLLSGNVFASAAVPMTGQPPAPALLGDVLLDNTAPSVAAVLQSGSFVEGSDVGFSAVAVDNCGGAGLAYQWDFSDHGVAFGNNAHHAFADNGTGYTGHVGVTDAADNRAVRDFDVQPIVNAAPDVTAPPNAAADWGRPISFHADAVDPGAADQPTLAFQWGFGDGTGAAGPDTSHVYANPGVYPITVQVTDKDGGVGSASLTTTISKRDTSLVYTGDTQALPNHNARLAATLSDEYGQAVVGRSVNFTLGTQTAVGPTDATGSTARIIRLNQKKGITTVSAAFAGDSRYVASSAPAEPFRIGS